MFVDEEAHDFRLRADSPVIGAGDALTRTVRRGHASQVTVADAKYFSDGFGMVEADWIRIGASDPVQIASIDYTRNVITLAARRRWRAGDPVNLYKDSGGNIVLAGRGPDIGAFDAACP